MGRFSEETCAFCGLHQAIPEHNPDVRAVCSRCGHRLADPFRAPRCAGSARAAALLALVLYPFAIGLPVFTMVRFGQGRSASIWSGAVGLLSQGELVAGLVVFLCSVLLPLLKLLGIVLLSGARPRLGPIGRRRALRFVEVAGRWGMLDVLLVAVLVAWLELGGWLHVRPGPGVLAFTLCVLCGLVAGALLDPRALFRIEASAGETNAGESRDGT